MVKEAILFMSSIIIGYLILLFCFISGLKANKKHDQRFKNFKKIVLRSREKSRANTIIFFVSIVNVLTCLLASRLIYNDKSSHIDVVIIFPITYIVVFLTILVGARYYSRFKYSVYYNEETIIGVYDHKITEIKCSDIRRVNSLSSTKIHLKDGNKPKYITIFKYGNLDDFYNTLSDGKNVSKEVLDKIRSFITLVDVLDR